MCACVCALDLIKIIQFCLKIYGWVDGWGHVKSLKSNKFWSNWDNSILFEDLWFVGTPPPIGGCMGGWVG